MRERVTPQVVILGAGLDGRAWRMGELSESDVFEVDHPASQQDKRARAEGMAPVAQDLRYVPVDFGRDDLDRALASHGHRADVPTTWVWEGVVPYLSRAEVEATMRVVRELSGDGKPPGRQLSGAVGAGSRRQARDGRRDDLEPEEQSAGR